MNEVQKEEFLKLVKWITDYPKMWAIVSMENDLDVEDCLSVIGELENRGFHLLIPVLLSNNINQEVEGMLDCLAVKYMRESWKGREIDGICAELRTVLNRS